VLFDFENWVHAIACTCPNLKVVSLVSPTLRAFNADCTFGVSRAGSAFWEYLTVDCNITTSYINKTGEKEVVHVESLINEVLAQCVERQRHLHAFRYCLPS
jgi:hypothetical protein